MIIWYYEPDQRWGERVYVYVEPVDGPLRFQPMTQAESLDKTSLTPVTSEDDLIAAMQRAAGRVDLRDPNWQVRSERLKREGKLRPAPLTLHP